MSSQPKRRPQKRKVNKRYRNHPVWVDGHIEWLTEAEHRAMTRHEITLALATMNDEQVEIWAATYGLTRAPSEAMGITSEPEAMLSFRARVLDTLGKSALPEHH